MSELAFEVVGARTEPYAAVPTILVKLRVNESSGADIGTIALRAQVQIEPRRRGYTDAEGDRLLELFGPPARWGDTLRTLVWTHATFMVPAFRGSVEVEIPITVTYDFEVIAAKYFHALDDGEIPLLLLFSGTVFERAGASVSIDQVSWSAEARYRLPVEVWQTTMRAYFPDGGWIMLRRDTFDALHRYRGEHALPNWDEAVEALLQQAREGEPV